MRNWNSYGSKISFAENINVDEAKAILADPQTSGGLLIAVSQNGIEEVKNLLAAYNLNAAPIGKMIAKNEKLIFIQS